MGKGGMEDWNHTFFLLLHISFFTPSMYFQRASPHTTSRACSNIVGTPLAAMLRDEGAAAVTICHRISYSE